MRLLDLISTYFKNRRDQELNSMNDVRYAVLQVLLDIVQILQTLCVGS